MNKKQKDAILIVLGSFYILAYIPTYMKTDSLENLMVYIAPGFIMIGIGVFRIFR